MIQEIVEPWKEHSFDLANEMVMSYFEHTVLPCMGNRTISAAAEALFPRLHATTRTQHRRPGGGLRLRFGERWLGKQSPTDDIMPKNSIVSSSNWLIFKAELIADGEDIIDTLGCAVSWKR